MLRVLAKKLRPNRNSSAIHQWKNAAINHLCATACCFHSAKPKDQTEEKPQTNTNEAQVEETRTEIHYIVYVGNMLFLGFFGFFWKLRNRGTS